MTWIFEFNFSTWNALLSTNYGNAIYAISRISNSPGSDTELFYWRCWFCCHLTNMLDLSATNTINLTNITIFALFLTRLLSHLSRSITFHAFLSIYYLILFRGYANVRLLHFSISSFLYFFFDSLHILQQELYNKW